MYFHIGKSDFKVASARYHDAAERKKKLAASRSIEEANRTHVASIWSLKYNAKYPILFLVKRWIRRIKFCEYARRLGGYMLRGRKGSASKIQNLKEKKSAGNYADTDVAEKTRWMREKVNRKRKKKENAILGICACNKSHRSFLRLVHSTLGKSRKIHTNTRTRDIRDVTGKTENVIREISRERCYTKLHSERSKIHREPR